MNVKVVPNDIFKFGGERVKDLYTIFSGVLLNIQNFNNNLKSGSLTLSPINSNSCLMVGACLRQNSE